MRVVLTCCFAGLILLSLTLEDQQARAQGGNVAVVNGERIGEVDLEFVAMELREELVKLPPEARRQALVNYLVELQLVATASRADKNEQGSRFQQRLDFARRGILRDMYFEQLASTVTDEEIQGFYGEQVARLERSEEVRLRHILLETEPSAQEILEKVKAGADFKRLARDVSRDPATNWQEGDLGFLAVEKLNESFARAVAGVASGVSDRIAKTEFGWHVVLVESRRTSPIPPLADIRDEIRNVLAQKKMRERITALKDKGKIDIVDGKLSATLPPPAEYMVSGPLLTLRSAPNPNSGVLAKLEDGSRSVFALGDFQDYEEERWIKVKVGSDVGWVNDRYVRPIVLSNVSVERKEGHEFDGEAYRAPPADFFNECSHACLMDDRCRAMEFDQKDKTCNLFKSLPKAKPNKNVNAGIKRVTSQ